VIDMIRRRALAISSLALILAACAAPTPPSTPKPEPVQSSPDAPAILPYTWPGNLNAGTYETTFVWKSPVRVRFTVPSGWVSRDVEVIKDPVSRENEVGGSRGLSVLFTLIDNVYADPCGFVAKDPPIGASVADAAAALAALPGVDASRPVPTTFAGYDGQYVELHVRDDVACAPADFHLFNVRPEWVESSMPHGPSVWSAERSNWRLWVLDIDGLRYVIGGLHADDATEADLAELQGVLDSVTLQK
jgi:hypothetical protein